MDAISAFWAYWAEHAARIAAVFDAKQPLPQDLIESLRERVDALSPGLAWEFGKGRRSRHHFCISSGGDPEGRVVIERWLAKAPPPNDVWELYPARQPSVALGMVLHYEGHEVDFDRMRCELEEDEGRARVGVTVHHPAFVEMEEEQRRQVVFLALDNALGEDDVERWLSYVEASVETTDSPITLSGLRERVREFAGRCKEDKWAILRGEIEGRQVFVTANRTLKRIDHPLMTIHTSVVLLLTRPTPDGLTTGEEATELNEAEDALMEVLGKDAIYLGRETGMGRRTLHFHVMESGPTPALFQRWAARFPQWNPKTESERDLAWSTLKRWG
jgi:hypothetical protein